MTKILFVCTGNTCRSPMAEALLKKLFIKKGYSGKNPEVSSAGIYAFQNDPASDLAIDVMREMYGIDITHHRATLLMEDAIKHSYLILTMTEHHREMILDIYPEAADKVYTLKAFAEIEDASPDIQDPFGGDYRDYEECAMEIESILLHIIDKLFDIED